MQARNHNLSQLSGAHSHSRTTALTDFPQKLLPPTVRNTFLWLPRRAISQRTKEKAWIWRKDFSCRKSSKTLSNASSALKVRSPSLSTWNSHETGAATYSSTWLCFSTISFHVHRPYSDWREHSERLTINSMWQLISKTVVDRKHLRKVICVPSPRIQLLFQD